MWARLYQWPLFLQSITDYTYALTAITAHNSRAYRIYLQCRRTRYNNVNIELFIWELYRKAQVVSPIFYSPCFVSNSIENSKIVFFFLRRFYALCCLINDRDAVYFEVFSVLTLFFLYIWILISMALIKRFTESVREWKKRYDKVWTFF